MTGIAANTIRGLARDFSDAPRAAAYGRIGLSTQAYGSLCQWAINLLNIVSGNLDREGGAMFTLPAVDLLRGQIARVPFIDEILLGLTTTTHDAVAALVGAMGILLVAMARRGLTQELQMGEA